MKSNIFCCFFTATKEPDGKVPTFMDIKKLQETLASLKVNEISKRYKIDSYFSPSINHDDLQFELEIDGKPCDGVAP